jgi:hypothetical protein
MVIHKNSIYSETLLVTRLLHVAHKAQNVRGLQTPAHAGSPIADFSTLKMEAILSSETSVNARSTQSHIPEGDILYV